MIIYSDIDVTFKQNPITKDIAKKTNAADIRQSLKLLFKTAFYSRLWNPEIGNKLSKLLFSQNNSQMRLLIRHEIERVIKTYEPRVTITALEVTDVKENPGQINIKVDYIINNLGMTDTYIYTLTKLR